MSSHKKLVVGKTFRLFDFDIYDEHLSKLDDVVSEHSNDSDSSNVGAKYEPKQFVIQMYGLNEKGETCSVFVNDFQPFFYAKVSDNWTQSTVNAFVREALNIVGKYNASGLDSAFLEDHHKLYGFSAGRKYKFVKFVFHNMGTFNKFKKLWFETRPSHNSDAKYSTTRHLKKYMFQNTPMELYESNIPPLLRYFHIENISPSGWVHIQTTRATELQNKKTFCTYEYICSKTHIRPLPLKETIVPYKICSFDIEASSSHGDFPIPIKSYKRLASNLVDTFHRQFHAQPTATVELRQKFLMKSILAAFGFGKCDDVDLVFPKQGVSKPNITNRIELFLKTPIDSLLTHQNEDGNANMALTITSMFDKMKSALQKGGSGEDDVVEDDQTSDMEEDDEAENEEESDETEPVAKPVSAQPSFRVSTATPAVKPEYRGVYIVHLLMSERDRDEKVCVLDDLLTRLFPALKGDEVTFIGSTFMKYGSTEPYLNHCLVVGSCDAVQGVDVVCANSEKELLLQWTDLIQTENPDIIIGYNIFGFDYEFMFRRAQENHIERNFLELSRKQGMVCAKQEQTGEYSIENQTIVLASGEYELKYYSMPGRLQIDMYTYMRREFTNLSSFKLDDVAGQFICDDVKKIDWLTDADTGTQTTHLYSANLAGLHVGDFIHIELSSFTSDYYADGKKFQVLELLRNVDVSGTKYNVIVIDGHEPIPQIKGKTVRWGMAKDDVTPQDIFRLSKGSSSDRAIVAKYCIQDCNLVHHLMNKVDVLTGYVEMARICSVPMSFLVYRGQSIKLTSYVAKKCREKNTLMPDLDKSGENDGYEGAIVLPPKCSMYIDNPVACVDYSSLYPSSMISNNLSHDSKVWTREYDLDGNLIRETGEKNAKGQYIFDNLPDHQYVDLEFNTYKYIRPRPGAKAKKVKSGTKIVRWAQFPNGRKGIMPSILEELLKARSDTRKMAKKEKDPFMANILDKRQLGYKVTANSLYGQCGAKISSFYEKDVAASTTATGRMMITYARRIIEEVYQGQPYQTESHGMVMTNAEYVYGDSVASYTPVYIRKIGTHIIDVCTIESLAEKYGVDGGNWRTCLEPGKQTKQVCELVGVETWTEKGWTKLHRVIRHTLDVNKQMVRVNTATASVDVTSDHSLLLPNGKEISPKDVCVGTALLHHKIDFSPFEFEQIQNTFSSLLPERMFVDHVNAAKYCLYVQSHGYEVELKVLHTAHGQPIYKVCKRDIIASALSFSVVATQAEEYKQLYGCDLQSTYGTSEPVVSISNIPYIGYVYDLTTENHHFAAGIGNMIVHNTDSVFFTFNLTDPKTGEKIKGQDALEITIEIAQHAAKLCTDYLKPPMELSYEKTLMPFILLSKKRYVGMLYETNPHKGKLKYMGLSIKRRDSCDYLKDTYGGILNILMNDSNVGRAIQFLDESLGNLVQGKVPMDKLMITRQLRSEYKDPSRIAHNVLAERIGKRDPGNKPKPGDRMRFVFIQNQGATLLGDRVETPEFIIENKMKIDYSYYITNQLMKPLQQLLGLAVDKIWEHKNMVGALKVFEKDMIALKKKVPDLELFMKQKEKYCSQKVKALLFDKCLQQIYNEKNKIRTIDTMWGKKGR